MGCSFRYFLLDPDDQLWGVPRRVIENLVHGLDRLPQYAGQSLKVITAFLDLVDGKPYRLAHATGSLWHFDDEGSIRQNLADSGMEAWVSGDLAREERASAGAVVSIVGRRRRREWERQNRWEPTSADITRIVHAIWPEQAGRPVPRPKWIRGVRKRRPPMTYAAKRALEECSSAVSNIEYQVLELAEPGLKAFIHETTERAAGAGIVEQAMWAGIAQAAEARLKILQARKRKGGTWVAAVDLVVWETDSMARHHPIAAERCAGRDKAEERARELVREHADKVRQGASLDVTIVPEIEWRDDD